MPVVAKEELCLVPCRGDTGGFGYDPQRGELWFAGETAEALLLELQARGARSRPSSTSCGRAAMRRSPTARTRSSRIRARAAAALAERLVRALESPADRFERSAAAEVDSGAAAAASSAPSCAARRGRGRAAAGARRRAEAVSAVEIEAARIEAEADEARRGSSSATPTSRPKATTASSSLATLERLERRRETLGQVNPLAHEEYEAEKARLEELAAQRADLEAASPSSRSSAAS
jgi:chromosome segregation protein